MASRLKKGGLKGFSASPKKVVTQTVPEPSTQSTVSSPNPVSSSWVSINWLKLSVSGQQPLARWGHAAAIAGTKIYILGGTGTNHWGDLYSFSTLDCVWTQIHPMATKATPLSLPGVPVAPTTVKIAPDFSPPAYYGAKMVFAHNNLWVFGGRGSARTKPRETFTYDVTSGQWSIISQQKPPSSRSGHTMLLETDSLGKALRIVLFGGNAERKFYSDLWFFNFSTLQWTQAPTSGTPPSARSGHAAVINGSSLYVFGGFNGSHYLDDLWVLDLTTCVWKKLPLPGGPSPRTGHQAALIRSTLVVFGGCDGRNFLHDLHFLDLNTHTWLPSGSVPISGSPPTPRFHHSFLSIDDACYIFGGTGSGTLYADSYVLRCSSAPSDAQTSSNASANLFDLYASSVLSLQHSEAERKSLSLQVSHLQTQLENQGAKIKTLESELADTKCQLLVAAESSSSKHSRSSRRGQSDSKTTASSSSSPSFLLSQPASTSDLHELTAQIHSLSRHLRTPSSSIGSEGLTSLELAAAELLSSVKEGLTHKLLEEVAELKRQKEVLIQQKQCICCTVSQNLVVLLPCKHQSICKACSSNVKSCPNCRSRIDSIIEPF